jgi:hypothetical protein
MFGRRELENLIMFPEVLPMVCGWRVIKRADWADVTSQRPHGLSYALILQDRGGRRILGFDNSHAYDGAPAAAPWDHEHRPGRVGQRFPYVFKSASSLINDFFDRLEAHTATAGVSCQFLDIQI